MKDECEGLSKGENSCEMPAWAGKVLVAQPLPEDDGGKLYDGLGNNADGAMTQRAVTKQVEEQNEQRKNLVEEILSKDPNYYKFGDITYYLNTKEVYAEDRLYSMDVTVESIDSDILAKFIKDNPPNPNNTRIEFRYDPYGGPHGDGNSPVWSYSGENMNEVYIPADEMAATTGIVAEANSEMSTIAIKETLAPIDDTVAVVGIYNEAQLKSLVTMDSGGIIINKVATLGFPEIKVPIDSIKAIVFDKFDNVDKSAYSEYDCPGGLLREAYNLERVELAKDCKMFNSVGNEFIDYCYSLKEVIGLFAGENQCIGDKIGSGFLSSANPEAKWIGFSEIYATSIGDFFLSGQSHFNEPLFFHKLESIGSSVLVNCDSMVSEMRFENKDFKYTGSEYDPAFTTIDPESPYAKQGIRVTGPGRASILNALPNSTNVLIRNLIDGGE